MDVRMPDGTIIRNVPEGMSKQDVLAKYQAGAGAVQSGRSGVGIIDKIAAAGRGMMDTATFGFQDEINAAGQALPRAAINAVRGRGFDVGAAYDEGLVQERGIDRYDNANAPIARGIGQVAGAIVGPGAALGTAARLAPRVAGAAAYGAGYGFGSGEGGFQNRAVNAAKNAALNVAGGEVGRAAMKGVGRVLAPAAARVRANPSQAAQFPYAADVVKLQGEGVPLTPGMALGGQFRRAEEALGSVPIAGAMVRSGQQRAAQGLNRAAANRALAPLGVKVPMSAAGKDLFGFVQDKFDEAYDTARAGLRFEPDASFTQNVTDLIDEARNSPLLSADHIRRLEAQFGVLQDRVTRAGGGIGGDDLKPIVSDIGKAARQLQSGQNTADNQALGEYLARMAREIDAAAARNPGSNPQAVQIMQKADRGYGDLVILQNAARLRGGEVATASAKQLDSAVQKADGSARSNRFLRGKARMQDLSGAAMNVMPENLANSGTPERAAYMALLGGGALMSPQAAVSAGLLSLPYAPGVNRATEALLTRRPGMMLQGGRRVDQLAAPFGVGTGAALMVDR